MENDEVDDIIKEVDTEGTGHFKYEDYVKEKLKDKIKK
jgi:Ca2+-binding EF-hand superfamily protein